jgi:uncharacterized protein YutE (UPF0331/DUF86 family)
MSGLGSSERGGNSWRWRERVVDAERLRRILQRISDDLATLEGYRDIDHVALLADDARVGHVKYLFVTAIEGCIDAAHHVCASEGWGPPETNSDAMLVLARHGTLGRELGETMAAAVRFRNVLVHGYAEVDDQRVLGFLGRVRDLRTYVGTLAGLIAR